MHQATKLMLFISAEVLSDVNRSTLETVETYTRHPP